MLYSKFLIPTLRQDPHTAECVSHRFLLRGGYLSMVSGGIYVYLPLGLRILNKVSSIIRKHMDAAGAAELFMSHLQPLELWRQSGRDQTLSEVMLRFRDKKGRDMCLGPTNEEQVTDIAKRYISSYKQLPVILYQIQTKFRDEIRPRYGLVRSCEFVMKDAYSFDCDQEGLDRNYNLMRSAYEEIFKECGLNFISMEADSGVMGGDVSHEFLVPADIGEDVLFYCPECGRYSRDKNCPLCGKEPGTVRMIETGHIFKLGVKYSRVQEAFFLDRDGKRNPFIMGCYGIGVSRVISAVAEQCHDEKGIIWPGTLAPFDLIIVVLEDNGELMRQALNLEKILTEKGIEVLVDDRRESAGVKFRDAYLIGPAYVAIMGKKFVSSGKYELENRGTAEKKELNEQELINFFVNNAG